MRWVVLFLVVWLLCVGYASAGTYYNVTTNWDDDSYVTILGLYGDEFDNGTLDEDKWWWVRESPSSWTMGDTYIQINSTNTDLNQDIETAPILLQNISNDDLIIITNLLSAPDANYEGGGLIFYADDDNFVAFMYFYANGNYQVIMKKEDNNVQVYEISSDLGSTSPIYLKLVKTGTTYTSYYSSDRSSWTQHYQYEISDTMTDAGILAYGAGSADPEPFMFNYFMTDNFTREGNYTVTHDAGVDNAVIGYNINLSTPDNTNISLFYGNNDTSEERLLGSGLVDVNGWINSTISGELYQDAQLILTLFGNHTNTPIIQNVTLVTDVIIPEDPANLTNATGAYWVNFTWDSATDADLWQVMIYEE